MANETQNQEFNKSIKMLQSMVKDKMFISLAEKFFNLKQDLSNLTRNLKEKETSLLVANKPAEPVQPAAAETPKVQEQPAEKPAEIKKQEFANKNTVNANKNPNFKDNRNLKFQRQDFKKPFNNNGNNNFRNGQNQNRNLNNQNRPFNKPNMANKPAGQKPFNKDQKRPSINFTQPVITASPARNFANKKKDGGKFEEKRAYTKRDLLKRGMIEGIDEDRLLIVRKNRTKKKDVAEVKTDKPQGPVVINTENITVKLLSELSGKPVSEIIKKFMVLDMMVTINSTIEFSTAELIMSDMGIELVQKLDKTSEDKLKEVQQNIRAYTDEEAVVRPPIVTVMGHVDHGKTSLLDYLRKSKVALGEAGGITQAIGAYRVKVNDKFITFIDTPGHEAFTAMRARGASVTDIAILIVAADDGVMPQTIEAINQIKAAGIPMIVAMNKMDKPQADPDRVMQQLAEHNVLPEEWGGDAIVCKISARTGEGIDKLLETILLVAEMQNLKANPNMPALGTIMEARLDKGKGAIASLIVKDGSLKIGDTIVSGTSLCKVKAMIDENNRQVKVAEPSMPVTVLGFNEVPDAGETFTVVDEKLSKQIVEERKAKKKEELIKGSGGNTLEDLIQKTSEKDVKILNIVLKTDVNGSLEAIKSSVMKFVNDEVKINILHSGVGAVNESDLILANASNAMVIAFNVGQDSKVKSIAERMKIKIYSYKIIYELLDEIERVVKGMKAPKYEEEYLGRAEVIAVFKLSTSGIVAGCMVRDGKLVRGEHARIYRGDNVVAETEIKSLKIVKDDVKEAGKDRECGVKTTFDEVQVGDRIECFALKRIDE